MPTHRPQEGAYDGLPAQLPPTNEQDGMPTHLPQVGADDEMLVQSARAANDGADLISRRVVLQHLQRHEMNGRQGTILSAGRNDDRWMVSLDTDKQ